MKIKSVWNQNTIMMVSVWVLSLSVIEGKATGIDTMFIDKKVSPANDFYSYANGIWVARNPVPSDESRWSAFDELRTKNENDIHKMLDDYLKGNIPSGMYDANYKVDNIKTLATVYRSGLMAENPTTGEYNAIKPLLASINSSGDFRELSVVMAQMALKGIPNLFSVYAGPEKLNSRMMGLYIGQGGLTLPDRDYYLSKDDKNSLILQEYVPHISKMFLMFGDVTGNDEQQMQRILEIETDLAQISLPRTALRDPYTTNNPHTLPELGEMCNVIDWMEYMNQLGIQDLNYASVNNPGFFKALNELSVKYNPEEWKTYLKWRLYHAVAPILSNSFRSLDFRFFGYRLKGIEGMEPQWKMVIGTINAKMPDALGYIYCHEYYDAAAEARMNELIENVKKAFGQRLSKLSWMTPETRKNAQKKLDAIVWKIGKPQVWKDYYTINITDNFCENVLLLSEHETKRKLAMVGKPVDRTEWGMSAATVNAYYNPSLNEIVFPAAILQPPFFNKDADDAVIYGAIGAVIGHEIIHGFDDQGRKYDSDGNLNNWWTPKDSAEFAKIAAKVDAQYSSYKVIDELAINGKLTMGENIADIGGLAIAYQAFQLSQEGKKEKPLIDGYTPEQRFFLSFAQVWRYNIKPEEAVRRVKTDPHSPGKYRCIGVLSNMTTFYNAFGVQPENNMYRSDTDRVVIW